MTALFTIHEVGCFIDGAYGMGHAINRMIELLHDISEYHPGVLHLLAERESDQWEDEFDSEWLDDATELLQDVTEDGLYWVWEAGDLILTDEPESILLHPGTEVFLNS